MPRAISAATPEAIPTATPETIPSPSSQHRIFPSPPRYANRISSPRHFSTAYPPALPLPPCPIAGTICDPYHQRQLHPNTIASAPTTLFPFQRRCFHPSFGTKTTLAALSASLPSQQRRFSPNFGTTTTLATLSASLPSQTWNGCAADGTEMTPSMADTINQLFSSRVRADKCGAGSRHPPGCERRITTRRRIRPCHRCYPHSSVIHNRQFIHRTNRNRLVPAIRSMRHAEGRGSDHNPRGMPHPPWFFDTVDT